MVTNQMSSTDEWINKTCYINVCNGILLSHTEKNEIMPFAAARMQLENIILSQSEEKDKCHMISLICGF